MRDYISNPENKELLLKIHRDRLPPHVMHENFENWGYFFLAAKSENSIFLFSLSPVYLDKRNNWYYLGQFEWLCDINFSNIRVRK